MVNYTNFTFSLRATVFLDNLTISSFLCCLKHFYSYPKMSCLIFWKIASFEASVGNEIVSLFHFSIKFKFGIFFPLLAKLGSGRKWRFYNRTSRHANVLKIISNCFQILRNKQLGAHIQTSNSFSNFNNFLVCLRTTKNRNWSSKV